jgi:Na+/proline symporter
MKRKSTSSTLFLCLLLAAFCLEVTKGDLGHKKSEKATKLDEKTIQKYLTKNKILGKNQDGTRPTEQCNQMVFDKRNELKDNKKVTLGVEPTVGLGPALIIFLLVGVFAAGIAQAFQLVRKHIFHDADNLDTAFDAGGSVSIGLTATTIVSQWTWSATLLQSSTVASKYGISGPYWYAAGATIQIILFSILSIMLKTRAPGAKTFLQVIKARFGARTHIVFCIFAFFTNVIVMMSLTVAGTTVLNALVKDLSPELAAMLLATVIGGYTLIGGLGATFYVSYFNTALIFILILMLVIEVFYNPFSNPDNPFGSSKRVYEFVSCWKAPSENGLGNREESYLTFFSPGGLVFGIVNIVGNFGTVFCDQAYWQSSVAAKPLQGVWGFILGGLTWFAIPFTLATTMGLAYLGMSSAQGAPLLSEDDIKAGLAAPLVAQKLLGTTGEYAMLFLILMAVMSTGSAEIIAVASIVIYDVYQAYVAPFRPNLTHGQCIICGKFTQENTAKMYADSASNLNAGSDDQRLELCTCPSAQDCEGCKIDNEIRAKNKSVVKPHYTCEIHKDFKSYQECLLNYKNWCIVICTFLSIPLCLFCWAVNLDLTWTYYFTGILIASSVVPIALSILWARATSSGMIAGVVGGCLVGMSVWLGYASTFDGGLSAETFVKNTGKEYPMMAGNITAIIVGALATFIVSLCTRGQLSIDEIEAEWEKTRDIDNPLNPWVQVYKGELKLEEGTSECDRPPLDVVIRKFRAAKLTAYVAGFLFTILFVCVWPGSMFSIDVMDWFGFAVWTTLSRGWAFIATAFIILVPLIQEVNAIWQQHKDNQKETKPRKEFLRMGSQISQGY